MSRRAASRRLEFDQDDRLRHCPWPSGRSRTGWHRRLVPHRSSDPDKIAREFNPQAVGHFDEMALRSYDWDTNPLPWAPSPKASLCRTIGASVKSDLAAHKGCCFIAQPRLIVIAALLRRVSSGSGSSKGIGVIAITEQSPYANS